MAQTDARYYATYCKLDTASETEHCTVNGDAIAVGLELTFSTEDYVNERGKECVRGIVTNPVKQVVGYLPADCARRFCDLAKAGWTIRIAASAVGFHEKDRSFWIEAAIFAYEPEYKKMLGAFVNGCLDRIGKGDRPDIRLSEKLIDAALEDKNVCKTVRNTTYPKLPKGDAYYKRRRTQSEGMIMAGSARKPGCIVGTIAAYAVIIAVVVFLVWKFVLGN